MTTRMLARAVVLAVLVAAAATARDVKPTAPPPRAKHLSPTEIDRLIEQLGSKDFGEREAATEALKRRPEAAPALLRADRTTTNPR